MALTDALDEASTSLQDFIDATPELPDKVRRPLAKLIGKMEALRACYAAHASDGGDIPQVSDDWQGSHDRFVAARPDPGGADWRGQVNKVLEHVHARCEDHLAVEPDLYIPRASHIAEVMNLTFEATWPWEEWEFEEKPR